MKRNASPRERGEFEVRPVLWSLEAAQHQIGDCSRREIYRLAAEGHLKLVKQGRKTKVTEESLLTYTRGLPPTYPKAEDHRPRG